MFPNPQDALPLPPRPNLEQYKKLSKDLVKACRQNAANTSTDNSNAHDDEQEQRDAISDWVLKWLETLARLQGFNIPEVREQMRLRS